MPALSFITTCRGRLAHLQETLPTFLSQPDCECIVVDYDCPDHAGDWVEINHPQVRVVRATNRPQFEMSRARNLGAREADTPWLCFIDADVRLASDFSVRVVPLLKSRHYYQAEPRNIETWGTTIVGRGDFQRVGGYDEVLRGWGKEDDDLYARLTLAGVQYASFPGELLKGISHDDSLRTQMPDVSDRWVNESINHVYCRAKIDLMLLKRGSVPRSQRQKLYDQVRQAILSARHDQRTLQIGVPFLEQQTRACGPLQARLLYTLPQPQGDPSGPRRHAASVIPPPPAASDEP